jgi:hypothetical protein
MTPDDARQLVARHATELGQVLREAAKVNAELAGEELDVEDDGPTAEAREHYARAALALTQAYCTLSGPRR